MREEKLLWSNNWYMVVGRQDGETEIKNHAEAINHWTDLQETLLSEVAGVL